MDLTIQEQNILWLISAGLILIMLVVNLFAMRYEKSKIFKRPIKKGKDKIDHANSFIKPEKKIKETALEAVEPVVIKAVEIPKETEISKPSELEPEQPIIEEITQEKEEVVEIQPEIIEQQIQEEPEIEPITQEQNTQIEEIPAKSEPEKAPKFIRIFVTSAEDSIFRGAEILENLQNLGFTFGENKFFNNEDESISVANAEHPWIFDLDKMHDFSTIGLVVFMKVAYSPKDLIIINQMIQNAEKLAEQLKGFVLDDQNQILTEEIKQDYLNRV